MNVISILGIVIILFLAWLLSADRKNFPVRVVIWGMILQFAFAVFVQNVPVGIWLVNSFAQVIESFLGFANVGSEFLFGNLVKREFLPQFGMIFAFKVLPTVIFFSSVMSVLYHLGIMPLIFRGMAWLVQKTLGTSSVESLAAAANVFLGQTESALVIKPYIGTVSKSELFTIMVGGFATIAGGALAGFAQMGIPIPALIIASIVSTPASLVLAKIVLPSHHLKLEEPDHITISAENKAQNIVEAAANGALEGLTLSLNIAAMLIAFIALVSAVNAGFGGIHWALENVGFPYFPKTLQELFGWILQPLGILVGIPMEEAHKFGALVGLKVATNEFVAYKSLAEMIKAGQLSERTAMLTTLALCSFANFSSIAIQIGGIGSLAVNRKAEIAELGLKGMIVGLLSTLLTTAVMSLLM